jgi:hypothetical protein
MARRELPAMESSKVDAKVADTVAAYAAASRGWKRSEYRIVDRGAEGALRVYWVLHHDDERAMNPGGGRSFAVHYDPGTERVIKEFVFQ